MKNLKEYPDRKFLLKLVNHETITEHFNVGMNSYYKSMYEVLADLEKEIQFKDKLDKVVLIAYKEFGDVIFRLKKVERGPMHDVWAYYEFDTTVS